MKIMKKISQLLELIGLIISLPFKISNGQKKRAYREIKKQLISTKLI